MENNKQKNFEEYIKKILGANEEVEAIAVLLSMPEEMLKIMEETVLHQITLEFSNKVFSTEDVKEIKKIMSSEEDLAALINGLISTIENFNEKPIKEYQKDFLKKIITTMFNGIIDSTEITNLISVPIEKENDKIKTPTYAHATDAGMDVYANEEYIIAPGETVLIPTGFKVAIPEGYELQVRPRSGLSLKTKLRIANSVGTVDASFRGTVGIIIENIEPRIKDIEYDFDENGQPIIKSILHGNSYTISKGDRIAQLVLSKVYKANFVEISDINDYESDRKDGGFGSTGK